MADSGNFQPDRFLQNIPSTSQVMVCGFCRRNGEMRTVYTSHVLRLDGKVTCPILRSYICPVCGATKDDAHTVTYCPKIKAQNMGKTLMSTTISLKTSQFKSNGDQRYH